MDFPGYFLIVADFINLGILNANLIKAIFLRTEWEGKSETYEFTIPRREPVGKISAEPIYAENGTTITGYIEKDISKEYCYIIKGDA